LRELHLLSSVKSSVRPNSVETFTFPHSQVTISTGSSSPPKGYGGIGRRRPRPLSGVSKTIFAPSLSSTTASTPTSGTTITARTSLPRRQNMGSRGSSISYKKDTSVDQSDVTDGVRDSVSSRTFGFFRKSSAVLPSSRFPTARCVRCD
jgi:hypothetical protein